MSELKLNSCPILVDDYLDDIDYKFVGYVPKAEALMFVTFIQELNSGSEENETPLVHLKMMDTVFTKDHRVAVLCHRGIGKTALFAEYLILFIASYGFMPGFGKVDLMLYISDSIENGVKNLRRNVEFRYSNSDFIAKLVPNQKITVGYSTPSGGTSFVSEEEYEATKGGRKFTDIRLEFENHRGDKLVVKGYGAKSLSLDSILYIHDGSTITIEDCVVGDEIFGADGLLTTITKKSRIFNKPMYRLLLKDGRSIKVSEDHINSVIQKENYNNKAKYVRKNLYTHEILKEKLVHKRERKTHTSIENLFFIQNCDKVRMDTRHLIIDPYTLGLLIGDGQMKKDGSNNLTADGDDMEFYIKHIPYELGSLYLDKRSINTFNQSIKGLSSKIRELELNVHGDFKFIPIEYLNGDVNQRLEILRGLMDTDGTISERKINPVMSFTSNSEQLIKDVAQIVRSLGGDVIFGHTGIKAYRLQIHINEDIFKLPRKLNKQKRNYNNMVAIESIERIEDEPSQCIAVDNEERQFITGEFVRTHNTGVRGAKEMGQRPTLAVFDDIVSDTDAESPTIIATIENTVYKAVSKALHPTRQKMVWLGTPFNESDPLYKAVESGAWKVACFPIAEYFDSKTTKDTFVGSWEERFTYEYVKREFDEAMMTGRPQDFYQELMLRISSDEERLIPESNIKWYSRDLIFENRQDYNYYIFTDAATSESKLADYSVITVWAVNNNGDILLVDGWHDKVLFSEFQNKLFHYVNIYKDNLMGVGIETSAQQKAFISTIEEKMIRENVYFTLLSNNPSGEPGLKPSGDKFQRFLKVQPMFNARKIWLPRELKNEPLVVELLSEIKGVAKTNPNPKKLGKARHDDVLDTVSQIGMVQLIVPTTGRTVSPTRDTDDIWYNDAEEDEELDSYSMS